MLACDTSITPHDFVSDKSYFGQLCLDRRGDGCYRFQTDALPTLEQHSTFIEFCRKL
jgi:hypothetical protein